MNCKIDVKEKFDESVMISSSSLGLNDTTLCKLNVTYVGHLPVSGIVTSTVMNDDVQSIVNSNLLSMAVPLIGLKSPCVRKRLPGKFHLWEKCKSYTWHSNQRLPVGNKSGCKSSSALERMVFVDPQARRKQYDLTLDSAFNKLLSGNLIELLNW